MTLCTCLFSCSALSFHWLEYAERSAAMLKLLLVLPLLLLGSILAGLGGLVLLPLLALLPGLIAIGAGIFTVVLTLGILVLMLRLFGAILIGVGGLAIGVAGFALLLAGGAIALVLGVVLAHLLLPLLLVCGLIWFIRHSARATPPLQVSRG